MSRIAWGLGIFPVLCLTALAGCSTGRDQGKALSAPTPKDVSVRIMALDDGKTIPVQAGTKIAVELIGVPTAGYLWAVTAKPECLEPAGEYGGPTNSNQNKPGFAGGSHWEAFAFQVTGACEGPLTLEQKRAWESDEPSVGRFSVTIKAS